MADDNAIQLDPALNPSFALPQVNLPNVTIQDLSKYLQEGPSISGTSGSAQTYDSLANARQQFGQELQNPVMRQLLMASTHAEVGGQGASAEQAYMESVMNRANAEGRSLQSVLLDTKYYPGSTISRLGRTFNQAEQDHHNATITSVLGGSNLSNLATGNESGSVRSGGAPITFNPQTGERFIAENWTRDWRQRQAATLTNPQQVAQTNTGPKTVGDAMRALGNAPTQQTASTQPRTVADALLALGR
jgi:hypothetical protein